MDRFELVSYTWDFGEDGLLNAFLVVKVR